MRPVQPGLSAHAATRTPLHTTALRVVIPLAAALVLIRLEPQLNRIAMTRPGAVPVVMTGLLGGLLVPSVRQWLITSLCFGIGILALNDSVSVTSFPPPLDAGLLMHMLPIVWAGIAVLAVAAALGESLFTGRVWARRCYFGAASLYFGGRGFVGYLRDQSWLHLGLMAIGVVASVGVLVAHRIVAAEQQSAEPEDYDIIAMRTNIEARTEALASHEWHSSDGKRPTS